MLLTNAKLSKAGSAPSISFTGNAHAKPLERNEIAVMLPSVEQVIPSHLQYGIASDNQLVCETQFSPSQDE
jgi:hypothetical protein